jgi:hypothetical protein
MALEFLLIVRHDKADQGAQMEQVAEALRDLLEELPAPWRIRIGAVEHAGSPQTIRSAERVSARVGIAPQNAPHERALGPPRLGSFTPPGEARASVQETGRKVTEVLDKLREVGFNALMLVGHQPAVDWFLGELLPQRTSVPLTYGEVACLCRDREQHDRWRLWWVLTPDGAPVIGDLREKVSSKMTVVSVLAGFSAAIAVQVLTQLPDRGAERWLACAAALLFGVAAVLFVGALVAYDQLMMPTRFWQARLPRRSRLLRPAAPAGSGPLDANVVRRPPSSAAWVLFQHAVRTWNGVVAALWIALVATIVLAVASVWPQTAWEVVLFTAGGLVVVGAAAAWILWGMPRLGSED